MNQIRWGIVGCGWIADQFAKGLTELPDASLTRVAARDYAKAQVFANNFFKSHPKIQASADYHSLLDDPAVDVVYIATTHHNHVALACAAVQAGKAVLVEKPVGLHAEEVRTLFAEAQAAGIFVMEAMWTRFIPAFI